MSQTLVVKPKQLREFGALVGLVFLVIGAYPFIKGHAPRAWALVLGTPLVVLGALWPEALRKPYQAWMFLGGVLGWVNTRLLLGIVYFLMLTPTGLVRRLFRKPAPAGDTYAEPVKAREINHFEFLF